MDSQTLISLKVNGKDTTIEPNLSVLEFLNRKNINPNVVACELNLTIIKRANLNDIKLKEGDTLEIIQMIGGG